MTDQTPLSPSGTGHAALAPAWRRALRWAAPALGGAVALYYLIGMAVVSTIDDDPAFSPPVPAAEGQSRAVSMAAALILREVDGHRWTANDPFFQPGWMLDNMPHFQQGMVSAVAHFAAGLRDRGGNGEAELERAAGLLNYPATVWMFDPSTSWAPTASTEKMYRSAARQLAQFNHALGRGDYTLPPKAETLRAVLAVLSGELDELVADTAAHLARRHGALFNNRADDILYRTKGKAYAHALLLRELGHDFAAILAERKLEAEWQALGEALAAAAAVHPLLVLNGAEDSLVPSHLAAQAFHVARARLLLGAVAARLDS